MANPIRGGGGIALPNLTVEFDRRNSTARIRTPEFLPAISIASRERERRTILAAKPSAHETVQKRGGAQSRPNMRTPPLI